MHARARLREPLTLTRDSFPKTSLGTKRAIYSRTLNKSLNYLKSKAKEGRKRGRG